MTKYVLLHSQQQWRRNYESDEEFAAAGENIGLMPYQFAPTRAVNEDESEDDNSGDERTALINYEARLTVPTDEWCKCDQCEMYENPLMNICCHELDQLQDRLFRDDLDCIRDHADFDIVVLHRSVLRTALVCMRDVKKASLVEPINERTFRLAAYRQFTWWVHQRLERRVRRVIPSCVVKAIRTKFPEPDGNYVRFREVDDVDVTGYPD